MRSVLALVFCAGVAAADVRRPEAAAYLHEMEQRGLVDKTIGTPERLAREVRLADEELVADRPEAAAARLYAIVEGSRYAELADSDDFQDAEYRLGLALHRGGSSASARRYLVRALARGVKAPSYHAALRTYVDTCLDERVVPACVDELNALAPEDVGEEIAYLRGRAAFDAGQIAPAEEELARVTPQSRFYSSALYLRGVARVRRGDFKGAEDAFCAIASVKEGDTLRFFIDGRYYALRDLARLALGRLAHEERRYDDAFYHYFLIPQDSTKLPDALFESAWSSLERKEYDLGARLGAEFLKLYPSSPRSWEARLLYATLQVKTCRFADAEKGFDAFLASYEPLMAGVDRALADPGALGALAERLVARARSEDAGGDPTVRTIASLLDVDPRFFRLQALARGLLAESVDAGYVESAWRGLESRVGKSAVQAVGPDAATLAERTRQLGVEIATARAELTRRHQQPGTAEADGQLAALEGRRRALAAALGHALEAERTPTGTPEGALLGMVRADRERATQLRARSAALGQRLEAASAELVRQSLVGLRERLEGLVRRARLGKIDAVVGQKRKLERQIEDLAAGRFPPELFGKLHIEGLIGDDEEYWPPERERWADEYEGYK
jgi:hypothetical protein